MDILFKFFQLLFAGLVFLLLFLSRRYQDLGKIAGWGMTAAGFLLIALTVLAHLIFSIPAVSNAVNSLALPGAGAFLYITAAASALFLLALGQLRMIPTLVSFLTLDRETKDAHSTDTLITKNINEVIFILGLDMKWKFITPSVEKFRGYTVQEALQQDMAEVMTPESIKTVRKSFRKEFVEELRGESNPSRSRTLELQFYHRDGHLVWGEVTATFLRDGHGNIVGIQGVNRDITERKLMSEALKESEERFRKAFMLSPEAVTLNRFDNGMLVEYNDKFLELTGYKPSDIEGKTGEELEIWADPGVRQEFQEIMATKGQVENFEARFQLADGSISTGLVSATTVELAGEKHLLLITKDITEIKKAQMALSQSEERLRATLEAIGDSVVIIDGSLDVVWTNPTAQEYLNLKKGSKCYDGLKGRDRVCEDCNLTKTMADGKVRTAETEVLNRKGETRTVLVTCSPMRGQESQIAACVESFKDITHMKEVERRLVETVEEKEVLLKEVHHRVKNNLQAITSLISLQALRSGDNLSRKLLKESQNRIMSMAIIHERLYRQGDLARVNMVEYLQMLTLHLKESYMDLSKNIAVRVSGDDIYLNTDTAIPCGLIVTEIVSNSFQHAYRQSDEGTIRIDITDGKNGQFQLTASDDGRGVDAGKAPDTGESLGLVLINTFVEMLSGAIKMDREAGTKYTITFSEYHETDSLTC